MPALSAAAAMSRSGCLTDRWCALLIRPYLLREAVASTMIEGTQASLAEIFELGAAGDQPNADVEEVLAYENDGLHWPHRDGLKWPHLRRLLLSLILPDGAVVGREISVRSCRPEGGSGAPISRARVIRRVPWS